MSPKKDTIHITLCDGANAAVGSVTHSADGLCLAAATPPLWSSSFICIYRERERELAAAALPEGSRLFAAAARG
eukprot:2499423-Amphidinium_carterae.1